MDLSTIDPKFRFTDRINYQIEKHSHEYRALATIRLLFSNSNFINVEKSENPDFIDRDNSIGLEVTDVCFQNHRQSSKDYYKLIHPLNGENDQRRFIKNINGTGADVISEEPIQSNVLDFKSFSADSYFAPMKREIEIKETKEYEHTKELDLALLFDDRINVDLEDDLKNELRISQIGKKKFTKIYVVSDYLCLEYIVTEDSFQRRWLTEDENIRLKILGRLTAEGKRNLTSSEWTEYE